MTNATVYVPSEIITITDASNKVYDSVDFETNNLDYVRVALVRHGATSILVNGTDYVITAIDTGYKFRVRITLTNEAMVGDELRLTMNTPYAASVDFLSGDVARIDFDNMQRSLENAAAQTATVAGSIGDSISDGDEALRKYVDEELGAIREKDREQDAKIDTAEILPRSGQVDTTQKTFFHDPNRILGQRGVPLYRVISILNGDEGELAKALYTQRQTGSFVSADNFRALSTETLTVGDETHEALVVTVPGDFNDFTFLAVEFNDADTELAKTIYIPVQTISNGFDWVISDARPQEDAQKRELRVRLVYDAARDVTQIKFHQEAVPSASDTSTEIYLYIGFFLRLAAIGSGGDSNHFVRVVRKEGVDFGDRDYYVENASEIVQEDEYYIVNPAGGGDLPATRNGHFAIKNAGGIISYTEPMNGDTAFIYADRQIDITDTDGSVSHANESKIAAILIYEGDRWVITNSYFKTSNDCIESGAFANAEGNRNEATGDYSHAEGWNSDATGLVSHAEGSATLASGRVSHAQGQGTVAKTDFSFIAGRYGVLGDPDTLVGIAWGRFAPNTSDETASVDKDLIWKINKDGDTTQDGTVTAEDFVKTDGTAITDLSGYYTKAESDTNDIAILGAAEDATYPKATIDSKDADTLAAANRYADTNAGASTTTDLTDMPQTLGTANAGKILEVNTAGDGYELTDKPSGGGGGSGSSTFTGLTDSPNSYTGQGGKFLQVNTGESALEFTDAPEGGGSDTPAHFVRTVRKEGTSVSDKDYYVENTAEIVQTDEFYIVNPVVAQLGTIPDANAGYFAIKASNGTITYTAPTNGDTAMVYADRQVDITDTDGNVAQFNENRLIAVLIYENQWVITSSYFKNANNVTETGAFSNAEGNDTTASGETSHAEGIGTTASGRQSHAEGANTTASGIMAHAEGLLAKATGDYSHAQNDTTTASGNSSHAEGLRTTASGRASHAQGFQNTVKNSYGHIQGRYGVVAESTTLSGIAYGSSIPSESQKTGSADVGLVWKADQSGNTTQSGKVTATDFVKADGSAINPPEQFALSKTFQAGDTFYYGTDNRILVFLVRPHNTFHGQTDAAAWSDSTWSNYIFKSTNTAGKIILISDVSNVGHITSMVNNIDRNGMLTTTINYLDSEDKALSVTSGAIQVIGNGTITEAKLSAAVQTKLNAESDGGANKAIEALASDREWKAEVQTYNDASSPTSPAIIGVGYKVFSFGQPNASHRIDFVFPNAISKSDIDTLVIGRKFVIEVPEGVITLSPTSHVATAVVAGGFHRERYDGEVVPSFTGFTYNSDGNNDYQTTLYRGIESGGATKSTELTDMPQTLGSGNAGKIIQVNTAGDGYELTDNASGGGESETYKDIYISRTWEDPDNIGIYYSDSSQVHQSQGLRETHTPLNHINQVKSYSMAISYADYDAMDKIKFVNGPSNPTSSIDITGHRFTGDYKEVYKDDINDGAEVKIAYSNTAPNLFGNYISCRLYKNQNQLGTASSESHRLKIEAYKISSNEAEDIKYEISLVRFVNLGSGGGGGGATTFAGLTDTPSALTGQAGKILQVNSGATALEFTDKPSGGSGGSGGGGLIVAKTVQSVITITGGDIVVLIAGDEDINNYTFLDTGPIGIDTPSGTPRYQNTDFGINKVKISDIPVTTRANGYHGFDLSGLLPVLTGSNGSISIGKRLSDNSIIIGGVNGNFEFDVIGAILYKGGLPA